MIYEKSEILGLHLPQVIKVKARRRKVLNGTTHTEYKKFSFNSHIISFDNLRCLLARAFRIKGEFTVNFLSRRYGLLPLTSDFDLDGALLQSRNFSLKLEVQPLHLDKGFDDWDIICPADIPPSDNEPARHAVNRLRSAGSFLSEVGRKMQRAFSFEKSCEIPEPERMPLDLAEFENFLDSDGRVVRPRELHVAVFQGGVEHSLRPIVWKHLLNVFPDGLTKKEREQYLLRKSKEYYSMRHDWQRLIHNGVDVPDVLKNVTNLVIKDVRRTDRTQKFFSGSDDNKNTQSLFNVLTTFSVNHQRVSYCQGMSDILSPILFVMKDEAHAYICFCGLMKRIQENFRPDGRSIKKKFRHLRKMLLFYDRELFLYLRRHDALGLLFCYRWLVLELKREFAYEDALHVLEVMWGSLPPKSPEKEICLYETHFSPGPRSNFDTKTQDELLYLDLGGLSWDENHFGLSPNFARVISTSSKSTNLEALNLPLRGYADASLAARWAARARRESQIRNGAFCESSVDEDDQIVPLRQCYRPRPYLRHKSVKSSVSFPGALTKDLFSYTSDHKDSERDQWSVSKSWAFGEDLHPQDEVKDLKQNNQWCYSNTVRELRFKLLNEHKNENCDLKNVDPMQELCDTSGRHRHGSSDSNYSTNSEDFSDDESRSKVSRNGSSLPTSPQSKSEGYVSDTASTNNDSDDYDSEDYENIFSCGIMDSMYGNHYEEALSYFHKRKLLLPPPHLLGDGNPFLLFLCVAMILLHRDEILRKRPDFNELGMFFDRLMRKHKVMNVVCKARSMFQEYLNMGWNDSLSDSEGDDDEEFEV